MIDVSKYSKNVRKKQVAASAGSFGYIMPFGKTFDVAEDYKITALPENALVTGVFLVVTEAFDAAVTVDIGTEAGDVTFGDDLAVSSVAVVAGSGAGFYPAGSDVVITLSGAITKGKAVVVLEYVEVATDIAMSVE